jgi:hypothetical protein
MKNKTKEILKWSLLTFVTLIITLGAGMSLAGTNQMAEFSSKLGLLPYMKILGIAEIAFVVLFMWPRTMKIGFLLLTAFFGGAMAVELSHGNVFIAPAIILSLVWIAAYVREPSIFKTIPDQQKASASY